MKTRVRTASLAAALALGAATALPAQQTPTRERARPPAAAPAARQVPNMVLTAAHVVVASVEFQPSAPIAGQSLKATVVLENQGTATSQAGLRVVVRCGESPGEPSCPAESFAVVLPAIEPGRSHRAEVALEGVWAAGTYRLLAAADAPNQEPRDIELVVRPAVMIAARPERPAVQQPTLAPPGEELELNPQPEPPSAETVQAPIVLPPVQRERPAVQQPALAPPGEELQLNPQPQPPSAETVQAPIVLADLAFAKVVVDYGYAKGATEATVYKGGLTIDLWWDSPVAPHFDWLWQVALKPFPPEAGLSPLGLVAQGKASPTSFPIDLGSFPPLSETMPTKTGTQEVALQPSAQDVVSQPLVSEKTPSRALPPAIDGDPDAQAQGRAGQVQKMGMEATKALLGVPIDYPVDFYIRILPTKGGQTAGPPSNTVVAHYLPGPDPVIEEIKKAVAAWEESKKKWEEIQEKARIYEVTILSFKPAIFADPNRWGCVIVVTNPYYGMALHPVGMYKPGQEYCPPVNPAFQEKSWDEQVWEGISGWGKAWDGLAQFYDDIKKWVAKEFVTGLGICSWLGDDLKSGCESVAQQVVEAAINVGLAAVGVPPTIPNLAALDAMAKGKIVDAAVEFTCDEIETGGGTCTPEMRAALAKAYQYAIDQLREEAKKQAPEPGCGDAQTANQYGKLPLPCFSDYPGAEVKAAPGAVEEPPQLTARITRSKPNPEFSLTCGLFEASLTMQYGGDQLFGFQKPYGDIVNPVPKLSVGQAMDMTLAFGPRQTGLMGLSEFTKMYLGAQGTITAAIHSEEKFINPDYGTQPVVCGSAQMKVQIPNSNVY